MRENPGKSVRVDRYDLYSLLVVLAKSLRPNSKYELLYEWRCRSSAHCPGPGAWGNQAAGSNPVTTRSPFDFHEKALRQKVSPTNL